MMLLPAGQAPLTAASLQPAAPAVTRVHPCAGGGGFSLCRGALDGDGYPLACCDRCARRNAQRGKFLHAPVLNEWRQWVCEGQVLHDGTHCAPPRIGGISNRGVGVSTA